MRRPSAKPATPEPSAPRIFGSREFIVRKYPTLPFGAHFCLVDRHIHVVRVENYGPDLRLTPAYRLGLKFGDRVHAVNGVAVRAEADVEGLEAELGAAEEFSLEVDQCPRSHKVRRRGGGVV